MVAKYGVKPKKMNKLRKVEVLQNRAIRIISDDYDHVSPHYYSLHILKLTDIITLKNCPFFHDFINKKLPTSFNDYFVTCDDLYTIKIRNASKGYIFLPDVDTVTYGRKFIKHQAMELSY